MIRQQARLLHSRFPRRRSWPGSTWWDREVEPEIDLERITGLVLDGGPPETLKRTDRRLVFRDGDRVVKAVFLPTWRRKLKFRRYATGEAAALLEAGDLGLRVPDVFAFGRLRRGLDPLVATVVVIEFLAGYRSLAERLELATGGDQDRQAVLDRASMLLVDLCNKGCCHIDVSPDNVFLADDAGAAPALIDWEYAAFGPAGDLDLLARQAGRLAAGCLAEWPSLDVVGWFEEILELACGDSRVGRAELRETFGDFCRRRMTRWETPRTGWLRWLPRAA